MQIIIIINHFITFVKRLIVSRKLYDVILAIIAHELERVTT